jgi:hypothetical protein
LVLEASCGHALFSETLQRSRSLRAESVHGFQATADTAGGGWGGGINFLVTG